MGRSESRADFGGWNKSKMRSCFRLCTAGCSACALRNPQVRQPAVRLARLRAARHAADLCIIYALNAARSRISRSL